MATENTTLEEITSRPLILITNDDGYAAPGIHRLAEAVRHLGDVYVVSPTDPRSGQSAALTIGTPLRISEKESDIDGVRFFTVNGTPVDCVKLALHAIVPRRPAVLFSGINHGSNSGTAVTYSGTMGAVLEGCMVGIPSVGFSLLHHSMNADFSMAIPYVKSIAADVVENGLPAGVCLNVNIPSKVQPEGVRICRAAKGHWSEEYVRYLDPQGNPFYWLTGRFVDEEPDAVDTDEYWLKRSYISVVPVSPDLSFNEAAKEISKRFEI